MHYHAEILLREKPTDIEAAVESAMQPFKKDKDLGWDWWQIGGRWTGAHDPAYDPREDEANEEVCSLCAGTGTRKDMRVVGGCNGCEGTGTAQKWPTDWVEFGGDVMPVADVPDDLFAASLIVQDDDGYRLFEDEDAGFKGRPVKPLLAELGIDGGWLVTVDYHF